MSNEAINWALAQPVPKSSSKFVLVAMANLADAEMICWPSMQYLINATSQDRKTVLEGMKRLRDAGFLVDTGDRKGQTKSVVVYRLSSPENGTAKQSQKRSSSKNEAVPFFPISSPVFPPKQSQISAEAVPKTGPRTIKEPSRNPKDTTSSSPADLMPDVDRQVLQDYMQVRKAKKAGELTKTAIAGLDREAVKAGLTREQAVRACAEFGWQGFNAGWYAQRMGQTTAKPPKESRHTGFDQRNYEGSEDGSIPA